MAGDHLRLGACRAPLLQDLHKTLDLQLRVAELEAEQGDWQHFAVSADVAACSSQLQLQAARRQAEAAELEALGLQRQVNLAQMEKADAEAAAQSLQQRLAYMQAQLVTSNQQRALLQEQLLTAQDGSAAEKKDVETQVRWLEEDLAAARGEHEQQQAQLIVAEASAAELRRQLAAQQEQTEAGEKASQLSSRLVEQLKGQVEAHAQKERGLAAEVQSLQVGMQPLPPLSP